MKIDFNSSYKSIAKIIFAKEQSQIIKPKEESFETKLEAAGRLNPKAVSFIGKTEKIETPVTQPIPLPVIPESPFKDELPNIKIPLPGIKQLPQELVSELPKEDQSVKTPTVVSAKRTSIPLDYQDHMPKTASTFKPIIESASIKHGVDPILGMAIAQAESSFDPKAISNDGHSSKGLFQLLDKTGKQMMSRLSKTNEYDPFDPELNSELGLGYLRYLHDIFSTTTELPNKKQTTPAANSASLEKLAVAAYNAGEGRVASAQRRAKTAGKDPSEYDHIVSYLPDITQEYVQKVTRFKNAFSIDFNPEQNS